jgi:hypothetical protein
MFPVIRKEDFQVLVLLINFNLSIIETEYVILFSEKTQPREGILLPNTSPLFFKE